MTATPPEDDKPEVYTLDLQELENVVRVIKKLNELHDGSYLETPDKILIRSLGDWEPIGYAVQIDEGWYFEAITIKEQKEIGQP